MVIYPKVTPVAPRDEFCPNMVRSDAKFNLHAMHERMDAPSNFGGSNHRQLKIVLIVHLISSCYLVKVVEVVVDHAQRGAELPAHGAHRVLLLLVAVGHVAGEPRLGEGALAVLAPQVLNGGGDRFRGGFTNANCQA